MDARCAVTLNGPCVITIPTSSVDSRSTTEASSGGPSPYGKRNPCAAHADSSNPEAIDLLQTVSNPAKVAGRRDPEVYRKRRQRMRFMLLTEDDDDEEAEEEAEMMDRLTSGSDALHTEQQRLFFGRRTACRDCPDCRDTPFCIGSDVISDYDDRLGIHCPGCELVNQLSLSRNSPPEDARPDKSDDNCDRLIGRRCERTDDDVDGASQGRRSWFNCCRSKSKDIFVADHNQSNHHHHHHNHHHHRASSGELSSAAGTLLSTSGLGLTSGEHGDDGDGGGGGVVREVKRMREWRRLKKCAFLCSVLLGMIVALAGIVIGFIIWHPVAMTRIDSWPDQLSAAMVTQSRPNDEQRIEYVTIATSVNKPVRDESGWVYFSGGSVNGSRYRTINKAMTFYAAQEQCRRLGGYLTRINSIREQVFLEDFLQQELQIEGIWPGAVGFWIGARRARGSHGDTCMFDQWKWMDAYGRAHGTISGFTAFIPGKPDNYYSPEECLFMSYRDGEAEDRFLKWDDAPCDLNSVGGIKGLCEVETR